MADRKSVLPFRNKDIYKHPRESSGQNEMPVMHIVLMNKSVMKEVMMAD